MSDTESLISNHIGTSRRNNGRNRTKWKICIIISTILFLSLIFSASYANFNLLLKTTQFKDPSPQFSDYEVNDNSKVNLLLSGEETSRVNCNKCGQRELVSSNKSKPPVFKKNSWPWHVSLSYLGNRTHCSASLISDQWILTSASCVNEIVEFIIHPEEPDHDFALMKFKRAIKFKSNISPICLPEPGSGLPHENSVCYVTGYGKKGLDNKPNWLRDNAVEASYIFGQYGQVAESHFYARDLGTSEEKCVADKGGPLVYYEPKQGKWIQLGIVSSDYDCSKNNRLNKFPKISSVREWIERAMDRKSNDKESMH
ncbi:MAG: hypothetical protein MHMPM18_000624 [Marteilia pararefringens]